MAAPKVRNWLGTKHGSVTVIQRGPTNTGGWGSPSLWIGQCACGRQRVVDGKELKKGTVKTCGYLTCPYRKPMCSPHTNKPLPRKSVWKLQPEEFQAILNSPCYYCGTPPPSGIDALEPGQPYDTHNAVPCCRRCAAFKGKKGLRELMQFLRDTVQHLLGVNLPG